MSASDYPKHCEWCKMTITEHVSHFSDVPGVGNLCKPCHKAWADGDHLTIVEGEEDGRKP